MAQLSSAGARPRGRPVGSDSRLTRRAILTAARQLIVERGYHAATFQQIALRAGVSRPTLHYYFDSREQVYTALLAEVQHRMSACIDSARRVVGFRGQLFGFAEALQQWSVEEPETFRFLVAARLDHHRGLPAPDAPAPVFAVVTSFYDSLVREAVLRNELRSDLDVAAVADMLWAVFWGTALHAGFIRVDDADASTPRVARQLLGLFESGLLGAAVPVQTEG